ncbi:MAG: baseplate J/gp47 family protein [Phormidesmis sp. CAN_BIN44]|nr:baseplate J/gp47 family protein [Phormidesmis sp. CAN_BIN44]
MNSETVNLINRLYPEIRDDLLTALVGGVVNEPIIFDDKVDFYPLSQAARDVRSITGTVTPEGTDQSQRFTFQRSLDFEVVIGDGASAIVWQKGGKRPDDDTIFYVDYFIPNSRSPITDINVGSVSRTICEAVGREVATVYQQINQAYLAGFVDTATGKSLDLVVAILGIQRKQKGNAIGLVTFFRDPQADGNITINEGTVLSTSKNEATFVTTEIRTLQKGQVRIDVPVTAGENSSGKAGLVKANAITTLAQPIAGISRVINFDATVLASEDETDEQLRARAKAALRGAGKGTLAALAQAIFDERAVLSEVWEPNSPPAKQSALGTVKLLIEAEPERFPSLQTAVEQTRAAGIQTTLVARYIYFKPRIVAELIPGLPAVAKPRVIDDTISAIQTYVDTLSSGDNAEGAKILDAIATIKEVVKDSTGKPKARIIEVATWRTDIGRPGTADLTDALLIAFQSVPPNDPEAQRAALNRVLNETTTSIVPTGRRIADRSLIIGLTGQPAKDGEIEIGRFKISATVGNEKWWIVLDLEPADIVLVETST